MSISIIANSGYPDDVQAAVNEAIASNIEFVDIPEGDWLFNGKIGGAVAFETPSHNLTIRGAGQGVTILRQDTQVPSSRMIQVTGTTPQLMRIANLSLVGHVESEAETVGLSFDDCNFRVDHCDLIDFSGVLLRSRNYRGKPWARGLVDHCDFDQPYKDVIGGMWGSGISMMASSTIGSYKRTVDYFLGKFDEIEDIVYIEDNTFRRCRHSIESNQNAWYVSRYNKFYDIRPTYYGHSDVHGSAGADAAGGRGLESYKNEFYGTGSSNDAHMIRGGGGVIYDNYYDPNMRNGAFLIHEGSQPDFTILNDLWLWNNLPAEKLAFSNGFTEGAEYHLSPRPGYIPYPYPHPLISGVSFKNLTVTSNIYGVPFEIRRIA